MKPVKHKVFAYITHGNKLLVFRHPFAPEAGIQVPAGTLEPGESPEDGVMREACEETGLSELVLDGFLGEQERDMADFERDEIHHRHFYHLRYNGPLVALWRRQELHPADDPAARPIFEFFWASLPDAVPPLIADHGIMLPRLVKKLALESTATGQAQGIAPTHPILP